VRAALSAALLAAACGGAAAPQPPDPGRTVRIEMSDFAFSPPQVVLQAGETVTLVLANVGTVEHELMAGTGAMPGHGYAQDWLASANVVGTSGDADHGGASVRVAARATAKLVFVVPNATGRYEFACFVPGHYESGMRGVIVVASAQPSRDQGAPIVPSGPAPSQTMSPEGHDMEMEGH